MSITHAPPPTAVHDTPAAGAPAGSTMPERPVFAARSHRRPLWLARIGRTVAVLVGLWVVALIAGALGLGRLPGVPDLRPSQLTARPDRADGANTPASLRGRAAGAVAPASVASDLQRIAGDVRRVRTGAAASGHRASKAPTMSSPTKPASSRRTGTSRPGRPTATAAPGASTPAATHGNGNGNGNGATTPRGTSPATTSPGRSGTAHGGGNSVGKGKGTTTGTGTGPAPRGHGYGRTKAPAATP
jgi:hypothetical protein